MATGTTGQHQTIYYAEVEENMKVTDGGGVDGEMIELYYLPLSQAKDFVFDETKPKPPGLVAAFLWFFQYKLPQIEKESK
jgi:UDP-sugar diphosphatase